MQRLFIGNLPFDTQEEELKNALAPYGLTKLSMPKDRETNKFRGFAFADVEEADKAIQELNGGEFGGRALKVSIAEERKPRTEGDRGGYNGGGGRRDYGDGRR